MPNWCVGDLKVRGEIKNVTDFLTSCIEGCSADIDKYGTLEVENVRGKAINGARRVFIDNCDYVIEGIETPSGCIVVLPISAAWVLSPPEMMSLSKKFNVDFRFYGFEYGQEFNQELEIIKGDLTLDKCTNFDDYLWESPRPLAGGQ